MPKEILATRYAFSEIDIFVVVCVMFGANEEL